MKKKSLAKISLDNIWHLELIARELKMDRDLALRYLIQFYEKNTAKNKKNEKRHIAKN